MIYTVTFSPIILEILKEKPMQQNGLLCLELPLRSGHQEKPKQKQRQQVRDIIIVIMVLLG